MSLYPELVDGLEQLSLFLQQLLVRCSPRRFIMASMRNSGCFIESPCFKLFVQDSKVIVRPGMHSSLNLTLVLQIPLKPALLTLFLLQLLAVFLLGTFLTRSPSGKHTTSVALYDDALLSHQSCLVCTAEVWLPWSHQLVTHRRYVQPRFGHLRAIFFRTLCRASAVLIRLGLTVKPYHVNLLLLLGRSLSDCVMVARVVELVAIASEVGLLHHGPLYVHHHHLFDALGINYSQLQGIRHDILLNRLFLIVVDAQLDANLVTCFHAQVLKRTVVREHISPLRST
mmetsp:Transcript_50248/g.117319  ORF Transcript_50248/g.117319 Transcript_50248/m.117319 type:complete len:284 (+) Transcript_50248:503-1354(+)